MDFHFTVLYSVQLKFFESFMILSKFLSQYTFDNDHICEIAFFFIIKENFYWFSK